MSNLFLQTNSRVVKQNCLKFVAPLTEKNMSNDEMDLI